MKYLVIIPVYDEANFIGHSLDSVMSQSLRPSKIVVVDDGSRDATNVIVQKYCDNYPWIQLITIPYRSKRSVGAKIINAFKTGIQSQHESYDFIVKMDSDILIPSNYFQKIANHFKHNRRIGIAGGKLMTERNGAWIEDTSADKDHVKGACKSYRTDCFKDMGGLRHSIGWDTADELLARFHGWEILVDPSLEVKHRRTMGSLTNPYLLAKVTGIGMYRMRYGLFISLLSGIKYGLKHKPYGLSALFIILGWLYSWICGTGFIVSPDEGRFIRSYRRRRMINKIENFIRKLG